MYVVATRAQIIHLLAYKKSAFHTVAENIDYMYHWIANLWHRDVHEFFIEQQIQIVLDALPNEWESVRQALKQRLSSLDFNTLAEDILLERESQLKAMGIRRTGRSARCLEPAARFVPWYEEYELGGHSDDNLDDIVNDPNYVPGM